MRTQIVFSVDYADGGQVGLFSTGKKAVKAAVAAIESEGWHPNILQANACLNMLRDGQQTCKITAEETVDEYDLSRIVVINKRRIQ